MKSKFVSLQANLPQPRPDVIFYSRLEEKQQLNELGISPSIKYFYII